MNETMNQAVRKPEPPAMLAQLDLALRAQLKAKNAPKEVVAAWDSFFEITCKWAAESGGM